MKADKLLLVEKSTAFLLLVILLDNLYSVLKSRFWCHFSVRSGCDLTVYRPVDNVAFFICALICAWLHYMQSRKWDKDKRSLLQLLAALLQCSNVIFIAMYSEINVHQTVSHSPNYVYPETGYHTRNVERTWVLIKSYMKKARTVLPHLQADLYEVV